MKLEINLGSLDECKLAMNILTAALAAYNSPRASQVHDAQPAVAQNTGSVEPAPPCAVGYVVSEPVAGTVAATTFLATAAVPADKPKRGRPAKPKDEAPAPIAEPAKPITVDELRAALQRLTARDGMPAGIELLKEYGCNRISELDQKDDTAKRGFIAKCPVLAEAEAA